MSSTPTKYVFVDLDECLIHCSRLFRESNPGPLPEGWGQARFPGDRYLSVAQLRPGAYELLRRIREIVPTERVFMLTTSIKPYAHHWNKEFGFNFSRIYHRTDIENCEFEPLNPALFPNAHAYHIDNLPRSANGGKVRFLKAIDPNPTYIEVTEFVRSPKDDFTQHEIDDVIAHITAPVRKDRGW